MWFYESDEVPRCGHDECHAEANVENDFRDRRSAECDDVEHRTDGYQRESPFEQSGKPRRAIDGRLGTTENEQDKRDATCGDECVSGPVCEGEEIRVHL